MASDIDIASNALQMIGAKPISDFDAPGGDAAVAKALFEPMTLALLTDGYWGFATKKQSLNRLSQEPLNEFDFVFQIPIDSLKVKRVYPRINYNIYRDLIYTNASEIDIDYIFRPETTLFPQYFVLALTYLLASEFALSVTDNENKNVIYARKHETALGKAYAADSMQHPQTPIVSSPFTDVRNGGNFTGVRNGGF